VLGALAPVTVAALYGDVLPIPLAVEPHPVALLVAALAGLLTMVLFVLWPLGRASRISPAVLMRAHLTEESERSATPFALGSVAAGLALFVLAIAASEERLVTAAISAGIVVAFVLLLGFGLLVQRLAARFRRTKPPAWGLALASIGAPGSLARSIAVSLGLGLGLLIAVALIHTSLLTEIESHVEIDAPAYYFLDVEPQDLTAFQETAKAIAPDAKMDNAPMLRGRIVALNGVSVDEVEVKPDARWVLAGDRGLTYTDSVPGASKIEEGEWWPKGYDGPPLVSFDGELAEGLGLKLGDKVTVNILGRNVEAEIASLRKIDWESLAINFVAAPAGHHARTAQGYRSRRRGQDHPGARRALSPRHGHQDRRHRRRGQSHASQADDRDPGNGRLHAAHRRSGSRGRRVGGAAAPEIHCRAL